MLSFKSYITICTLFISFGYVRISSEKLRLLLLLSFNAYMYLGHQAIETQHIAVI